MHIYISIIRQVSFKSLPLACSWYRPQRLMDPFCENASRISYTDLPRTPLCPTAEGTLGSADCLQTVFQSIFNVIYFEGANQRMCILRVDVDGI